MEALVLGLLWGGFIVFLAFTGEDAKQLFLFGAWSLMLLFIIGQTLYYLVVYGLPPG